MVGVSFFPQKVNDSSPNCGLSAGLEEGRRIGCNKVTAAGCVIFDTYSSGLFQNIKRGGERNNNYIFDDKILFKLNLGS